MLKRSLESLVGGCVVYAAMAACSGGGSTPHAALPGASGDAHALEGGQPSMGGAPVTGAGANSLAGDPVPNAMAASGNAAGGAGSDPACGCVAPEPIVVEAACEPGKSTAYFAVAQFPGKTVSELASVRVLVKFPDDAPTKFPASFAESYTIGVAQLDDGVAAVQCGSATVHAEKVTFTL